MALPAGVSTCQVNFGSPASGFTGEPVSVSLSTQPDRTLIHESGQPVIDFLIPGEAAEGMPGSVALPHVDQPGFRDQAGNEVTGWAYVIAGAWKSGNQSKPFKRILQPLVGQTSIDLDLVTDGPAVPAVSAPTLPVTSLAGLTGAVTAQQVQAILDAGVPADATWDTVQGKPTTFPPSAHGHVIADVSGLQAALEAAGSGGGGGSASWSTLSGKPVVIAAGATLAEARAAIGMDAGAIPVLSIDTGGVPILDRETWVPTTYRLDGQTIPGDIRGRGNSTWGSPKKPWNMRLTNTTALLGMPGAKRWSLLANYSEVTQVHNATAFEIGRRMSGLDWTPRSRYVWVVLNGADQGLYLLTEPVRMETGRVEQSAATGGTGLPLTGTYLLEADFHFDSAQQFLSVHDSMPIMLDTPDGTDATNGAAQYNYIRDWINNFEAVLYGASWLDPVTGYAPLIDRDSFIDYYLVAELCANVDAGLPGSLKMYKTRDVAGAPGKLFLGPLWDYDLSMGETWTTYSPQGWWVRGTSQPPTGGAQMGFTWIARMMSDPDFEAAIVARWAQMVVLLADLPDFIDRTAMKVAVRRRDDYTIWESGIHTYSAWAPKIAYLKTWLSDRMAWITANIGDIPDTEPPSVPTGLAASSVTATGFTVSWNAATDNIGVTGYQVRRDGGTAVDKTGLSHSFTGLTAETAYSVDVRARDAAGNWSAWSTALPVTTGTAGSSLPAPAAAWGFAEASGTTAADSSGNGRTLTTTAGMLGNAGRTGNGLRQVGVNGITIPSTWIVGAERTIMFWARKTMTNQGTARGVALEDDSLNTPFGVVVESVAPQLQFRAYTNVDSYLVSTSVTPINEQHHYCCTVVGGKLRGYLDGVQVGADVTVAGTFAAHTKLTLNHGEFIGLDLDDVRVLNVGVSAAEVAEFMATPV